METNKIWTWTGYTKEKVGCGRKARYKEKWIYTCLNCGNTIKIISHTEPPEVCPHCHKSRME